MDIRQANLTDRAWSSLLQLADRYSDEALQLLRSALEADVEELGDRDEAKLHLAAIWGGAYKFAETETLDVLSRFNAAERDTLAAAVLLHQTTADASKVLWRIATALDPGVKTEADVVEFPPKA